MKAMLVPEEGDSYAPRNLFPAIDIRFAKEAAQLTIWWLVAYARGMAE
jgi:hypothetical protein